jgi:hypothetical protein
MVIMPKINTSRFYFEWKGHPIHDIETLHDTVLSLRQEKPIVYLAGDSSLDNKYWVPSSGASGKQLPVPVPPIYLETLDRPQPKPDIAFWLNHFLGDRATALNLAVEESMLRDRDRDLLPHDEFIRDHLRPQDILIVSVGANDIALRPSLGTILNMAQLAWLTPRAFLERGLSLSLGHFRTIFGKKIRSYIARMTEKQMPRAVIVCMIYFPLESGAGDQSSWADMPLQLLGYNSFPGQLQTAIRKIYDTATKRIELPGTDVIPCALFEVLDGKRNEDYSARVEPSVEGGRKIASHFNGILDPHL